MKKFLLVLLVLFVGFQGSLMAQEKTVTGKVTGGDDGLGIPRVNVTIKGTSRGVPTDIDGNYTIQASSSDVLSFSFIGYITQEVAVGNQTSINVTLQPDVTSLEEVVVVGYGSQEKKEITSSVISLDTKDFNVGNINSASGLLQGKVAGLSVYQKGGDPNSSPVIRLRGISTVGSNVEPLVVIDGVIGASLSNVDPNDIATFDVLKDGSAAAIYGSRGSAGVIIVTTKQGSRGASGLSAEYSGYVAAATVANFQPVMNRSEFIAAGGNDLGSETDWQKEITRTGVTQVHNVSVSGGSENTTFRLSTNFRNVEGVLKKSGFDQVNARASIDHYALNDKLNIKFNMALTSREQNFSFNEAFRYAALYNPTAPIRFDNGEYFQAILFDNFNPVAIIDQNQNVGKSRNLNFSVQASYELAEGLNVTASYAQQLNSSVNGSFFPATSFFVGLNRTGLARRRTDEQKFTLFEAFGSYIKKFDNANLTFTAGYSFQEDQNEGFNLEAGNFPTNALGFNILGTAADLLNAGQVSLGSYLTPENRIIAFFGRVNATIDEGIFLNASVRREGSTKLGVDNQWGFFPAFGAGVDILNYADIAGLNALKFRVGYGVTGALPDRSGLSRDLFRYDFGANDVTQSQAGNPDLKWEEKAELNIGVDFALMDNKLSGTVDVYSRNVSDFILSRQVDPAVFGASTQFQNAGKLNTKGAELSLNYSGINSGDFTWTPGLVMSTYSTTLEEFVIEEQTLGNLGSPGQNGTPTVRIQVGEKIGQIWGPVYTGVSDTGSPIFADLNGDGVLITGPGSALDDNGDFQELGKGFPTLELGWTNTMSYKNWGLNMFFRGAFGHSLVNSFRAFYEPRDPGAIQSYNRTLTDLAVPSLQVAQFSSLYVEKADFLRLDNVTLGYNFDMSNNANFKNIRVYFNVQNAFTITNYQGIDPEPSLVDIEDGNNPLATGIDRRNNYFTARTFTFGLNIGF
uniref:SusC/RagA family TonB-linked outer membrane protein n=1 Tax=Roseivirga sp. TaxID=1964215 RepID=UPI00404820CC